MNLLRLRPAPKLLTLEGMVAHGYVEPDVLLAILNAVTEELPTWNDIDNTNGDTMQGYRQAMIDVESVLEQAKAVIPQKEDAA